MVRSPMNTCIQYITRRLASDDESRGTSPTRMTGCCSIRRCDLQEIGNVLGPHLGTCHAELINQLVHAHILKIVEHGGDRVPLKTQASLRLPGTLSMAGHCDQSSVAIGVLHL